MGDNDKRDSELSLIGEGLYCNWLVAAPYSDGRYFRIVPKPFPVLTVAIMNLLFAAFFYGFHWAATTFTDASVLFASVAPLGIGLVTCVAFTGVLYLTFRSAQKRGPWLEYDKWRKKVRLPREGLTFELDEVVYLQDVQSTQKERIGPGITYYHLSELNLVTCKDGRRKRWNLLNSNRDDSLAGRSPFAKILDAVVRQTPIPVYQVRKRWLHTETPVRPYRPRD